MLVRTGSPKEKQSMLGKVSEGDESAIKKCLEVYGDIIWSLVSNSVKSNTKAENLTQEIFQEIWETCQYFDSELTSEPVFILLVVKRKLLEIRKQEDIKILKTQRI